jgi:cell division transport system permease protein
VIGFVAFTIKQGVQGLWRNRVMSFAAAATMAMMLMLLAGLVIVLTIMQLGAVYIESKVEVRAQLNDGVAPQRVDALTAQLRSLPEVTSVGYISKDQALEEFRLQRARAGESDLSQYLGYNPFPAQLTIKLADPKQSSEVHQTLDNAVGVVAKVLDDQSDIDKLVNLIATLRTVGIVVLAVVGLAVLLIVVNAIRMALMSRAEEIEIMRLVGASDRFIRWPFVFEGLLVGLIAALVTLGLLSLGSDTISQLVSAAIPDPTAVPPGTSRTLALQLASLTLGMSLILGGAGAWISVRAYLRR